MTTPRRRSRDAEHFLTHQGRARRYLVHEPAGADPGAPLPLVLAFHGGLGCAEVQRRQSGLDAVADRAGFRVVYPDGTGPRGRLTWNAGRCCGYAVREGVDDVGFVDRLLDALAKQVAVEPRRVYACGMSNGAMLCYRLACELSERIAAIGAVAGSMSVDGPAPARAVPVIHFHGLEDENVRFAGGVGRNQLQPLPHRPVLETIAWWVDRNRCRSEPEVVEESDCIVERYEPARPGNGAPVVLYKLPGGGHTWPGGLDVTRHLATGRLVNSVPASALVWEFFRRFELPKHR